MLAINKTALKVNRFADFCHHRFGYLLLYGTERLFRKIPIVIPGSLRRFAIAGPYGKFCSWSDLFTYVFYCNA